MSYIVRVNGEVVGVQVLSVEEIKKYNNTPEISLEKN